MRPVARTPRRRWGMDDLTAGADEATFGTSLALLTLPTFLTFVTFLTFLKFLTGL